MLLMLIIQDQLFRYYRHPQASAGDSIPELLTPFYHNLTPMGQPLLMTHSNNYHSTLSL